MSKPNGSGEEISQKFQEEMDARITARDALRLDPTERAQFVHELLFWALDIEDGEDATISGFILWDILCYCVHLINQYAMALQDEDFMVMARVLNTWLFTAHYNMEDTSAQLGPMRDKHIEFWQNQLYEPKEEQVEEMS